MELLIFFLVIALLFGLGGLLTAAKWLIILALLFMLFGFFSFSRHR